MCENIRAIVSRSVGWPTTTWKPGRLYVENNTFAGGGGGKSVGPRPSPVDRRILNACAVGISGWTYHERGDGHRARALKCVRQLVGSRVCTNVWYATLSIPSREPDKHDESLCEEIALHIVRTDAKTFLGFNTAAALRTRRTNIVHPVFQDWSQYIWHCYSVFFLVFFCFVWIFHIWAFMFENRSHNDCHTQSTLMMCVE